jgi:acyl carrier protein
MANGSTDITDNVRRFILTEFLPDEGPDALENDAPLISSAILDSIATIKLVAFLEEQYGVHFEPHEMSIDYLDTVSDITATIRKKLAAKG